MSLEPTSERMIEEYRTASPQSYLIYLFHIVTYDYVRDMIAGKTVLDFGCGSGYGTARIAEYCAKVVGIDISADAVAYAKDKYRRGNLDYVAVPPVEEKALPFPDASFDVVLSFQVIEHVRDVNAYLSEIRRVLKPGGTFVVATPDRSSRLFPGQKPWNMWHLYEYSADALRDVVARHFGDVTIKMMGGRPDVIALEARRTLSLRWILLPLTLPFIPEVLRVAGLNFVRQLGRHLARPLARKLTQEKPAGSEPVNFGFGPEQLSISDREDPSVNLIAIARRQ